MSALSCEYTGYVCCVSGISIVVRSSRKVGVVTGESGIVEGLHLRMLDQRYLQEQTHIRRRLEATLPMPVSIRTLPSDPGVLTVKSRSIRKVHVAWLFG